MRLITLIFLLITPSFVAAQNYLCITEDATGFTKKDGKYETTTFTSGDKFIFSKKDMTLRAFGVDGPLHNKCEIPGEAAFCSNVFIDFSMHMQSLRFMIYLKSYGYVWENVADTPHIAVGTCSKF